MKKTLIIILALMMVTVLSSPFASAMYSNYGGYGGFSGYGGNTRYSINFPGPVGGGPKYDYHSYYQFPKPLTGIRTSYTYKYNYDSRDYWGPRGGRGGYFGYGRPSLYPQPRYRGGYFNNYGGHGYGGGYSLGNYRSSWGY